MCAVACAACTPVEDKLRRAARVMGRLTALHELWKHVLVAWRVRGSACAVVVLLRGRCPILVGTRSRSPRAAPSGSRRFLPRAERVVFL